MEYPKNRVLDRKNGFYSYPIWGGPEMFCMYMSPKELPIIGPIPSIWTFIEYNERKIWYWRPLQFNLG